MSSLNLAALDADFAIAVKIVTAPNIATAEAALKAHFLDVGADVALLETALSIAGIFFAPAAEAGDLLKAFVVLYNVIKTARGLNPVPPHEFTAFGHQFTGTLLQGSTK